MASELTSALAEAFVREVSDAQLMRFARIFDPARAKREEFFARLIQAADQGQRELLWKLIAAAVGDAINRLLVFVNLEHEERELRLILRDPVSGSEEPFLDDDDLIDLHATYWTEWQPAFSRVASGYPAPTGEDAEPSDVPTGRDAVAERSSQSAWIESLAPTFIEEVRDRALLLPDALAACDRKYRAAHEAALEEERAYWEQRKVQKAEGPAT